MNMSHTGKTTYMYTNLDLYSINHSVIHSFTLLISSSGFACKMHARHLSLSLGFQPFLLRVHPGLARRESSVQCRLLLSAEAGFLAHCQASPEVIALLT